MQACIGQQVVKGSMLVPLVSLRELGGDMRQGLLNLLVLRIYQQLPLITEDPVVIINAAIFLRRGTIANNLARVAIPFAVFRLMRLPIIGCIVVPF